MNNICARMGTYLPQVTLETLRLVVGAGMMVMVGSAVGGTAGVISENLSNVIMFGTAHLIGEAARRMAAIHSELPENLKKYRLIADLGIYSFIHGGLGGGAGYDGLKNQFAGKAPASGDDIAFRG